MTVQGAAAGNVGAKVILRNVSTQPCHLIGYPGLQLLGADDRPLPTTVRRGGTYLFPSSTPALVGINSGGTASFDIGFRDFLPGPQPPQGTCRKAARLAIIVPNDTAALLASTTISPCGGGLTTSPVINGTAWIQFT